MWVAYILLAVLGPALFMAWYAENPKQWLNNAFQNAGSAPPVIKARRGAGQFVCVLDIMGRFRAQGSGRTPKEAEASCARDACRMMDQAGLMTRQVSQRQRSKSKKKRKKSGTGGMAPTKASGGHPFVLPFATPTYNGANPAKKGSGKFLGNGKIPHISLDERSVRSAMDNRWVRSAKNIMPPLPYTDLHLKLGQGRPGSGY